jgi:hypothetical protein
MEITLRKASALSKLLLETARGLPLTNTVTVSIYSTSTVADEVAAAQAKLATNVTKAVALTKAAFSIREAIGNMNAVSGIDALLTEDAGLSASEKLILGALGGRAVTFEDDSTDTSVVLAQSRLDAIRERQKVTATDRYSREDSVSVNVLGEAATEFQSELVGLRRRKTAIADELLGLNMTKKVTLSPQIVTLLEEFKLV